MEDFTRHTSLTITTTHLGILMPYKRFLERF